MRLRITLPILAAAMLVFPAAASAFYPHTITPGESLSSVAAADGLSVAQLAAANGISAAAPLTTGSTLMIPPQGGAAQSAAPVTGSASSAVAGDGDGDADDVGASSGTAGASSSGGSYVVQPGDTLSAIAARAGVSVAQLAAANGLDPNGTLLSGSALSLSGGSSGASSSASSGGSTQVSTSSGSSAGGAYVVQPGDTLSAIAARAGTSVAQLAVSNGLDPNGPLLSGSTLRLSGSSSGTAVPVSTSSDPAATQPVGTVAQGNPTSPPYPTPERVSGSEVGSIAAENGVPPSLAQAVGWQESGFNNDLVSSADARGVMQILPGTWEWIQRTLTAGQQLAPASAASNVRGGVLLLHSLLNSTGGDPSMAAAGYYQGLSSVRQHGLYSDTQQYVNSVMSLARHFGGG